MDFKEYQEYVMPKNNFVVYNHITLAEMGPDRAVTELIVNKDGLNPLGYLHGGAYFTLSDCAASAAARSNGLHYVTVNSSFEFIHNTKEGKVRATATIRHRGRTTCLSAVEVRDEKGGLLAEGKFTMFCLNKPVDLE